MQLQRINTIAELQAEQDRLKANMRVARSEFHKSAARTTADSREFLLKNILLPAGAIGLGVLVAKKLTSHHEPEEASQNGSAAYQAPSVVEQEKPVAHWFSKLMLVALPLVQQFLLSLKNKEEAKESEAIENKGQHIASKPNPAINWMATILPIAIPLLQQYFVKKEEAAEEHMITFDANGDEVTTTGPTDTEGASAIFESLFRMLPVVLPLVQQFLATRKQAAPSGPAMRYAGATA